jgi:transcription initiation factor IIE alpha subunit
VSFDYESKNNDDDLLDAVEIALSAAGVLFAVNPLMAALEDTRGAVSRRRRTSRSSATRTSETSTTPSWGPRRNR